VAVQPDVTGLLRGVAEGSKEAEAALFSAVYQDLRRIARRALRGDHQHTLQTTALVNEAYLRLTRARGAGFNDRVHFFATAARAMRNILVDYARAKQAEKRGGRPPVPLDGLDPPWLAAPPEQVLAVDAALERLARLDARQARIVELRFFAGMTEEETADALHVSSRTVRREWQVARAWLYGELQSSSPQKP
jgi:RNA polymerase sigma factor (TIGR02999 family)